MIRLIQVLSSALASKDRRGKHRSRIQGIGDFDALLQRAQVQLHKVNVDGNPHRPRIPCLNPLPHHIPEIGEKSKSRRAIVTFHAKLVRAGCEGRVPAVNFSRRFPRLEEWNRTIRAIVFQVENSIVHKPPCDRLHYLEILAQIRHPVVNPKGDGRNMRVGHLMTRHIICLQSFSFFSGVFNEGTGVCANEILPLDQI
jgi:hypothetical protein